MRNIGGRITLGVLEQWVYSDEPCQVAGEIPGGGGEFHLIALQHADYGITRLSGDPALLTRYFPKNSMPNWSPILARRLQSTSLRFGRFRRCRATG